MKEVQGREKVLFEKVGVLLGVCCSESPDGKQLMQGTFQVFLTEVWVEVKEIYKRWHVRCNQCGEQKMVVKLQNQNCQVEDLQQCDQQIDLLLPHSEDSDW